MPPKKAPSKKVPAKKAAKAPVKGPTVKELREKAKAQKIKGYSSMKKDELVKALGKRPKSPSPTKREKSPSGGYNWQWKVGDIINYPQLVQVGHYPTIQGKWIDFVPEAQSDLERKWASDPTSSDILLGYANTVSFKHMTISWFLRIPNGHGIQITDSIRRVKV